MKGVVFTEFIEMVEEHFSPALADQILSKAKTTDGGAYTAVGTYDYCELQALVGQLSVDTGHDASNLVKAFGQHLFERFAAGYPQFFDGVTSTFDFLENVDSYIHVEVRKLYPDAELPAFECERPDDRTLEMVYRSQRPFADLADGLIARCVEHFGEEIAVTRENLDNGSGCAARFHLQRQVSS